MNNNNEEVKSAAGEFSNNYWGFYEYIDKSKTVEKYDKDRLEKQ